MSRRRSPNMDFVHANEAFVTEMFRLYAQIALEPGTPKAERDAFFEHVRQAVADAELGRAEHPESYAVAMRTLKPALDAMPVEELRPKPIQ